MKNIVILELNNITQLYNYADIIKLLITGYDLRYTYPDSDIYCKLNRNIINSIPNISNVLSCVYDNIIETSDTIRTNSYGDIKYIDITQHNNNIEDNNFIYNNLKKHIGPNISNSFMFKEHDILIHQTGGINLDTKKIVYKDKKNNPIVEIISKLYNVKPELIVYEYSNYYHLVKNTQFRHFNLKCMFDDIEPYDYLTPIKKLAKYNSKNNYYQKIINKYNDKKEYTSHLNIYDNIDTHIRELIITQYIKCRPNTFMLVLWMTEYIDMNKFIKLLERSGNIYYIKTISLTRKALKNLMFWMYDNFTYETRLKYINSKLKDMKIQKNNNAITIILFDNIKNKHISGKDSKFKQYLRKELNKMSKINILSDNLLHINDYFYQTVELTELLFNNNSIDILNKQNCKTFTNNKFTVANTKLQTYRHILYKNFSLLEHDRIICTNMDDYNKAIKPFTNINILSIDINPNNCMDFNDKLDELFNGKNVYFINHTTKNINKKNILDPLNYYYFHGVKFIKKNES